MQGTDGRQLCMSVWTFAVTGVILLNRPAPGQEADFLRGDSNADGALNISDGVFALSYLFLGGNPPTCLDAVDADDSGMLNITDAIFTLEFLFLGGPQPPAPGHIDCGPDISVDGLGCASFAPCAAIANRQPMASAVSDEVVAVGSTVQLDGRASSDPDGDSLTFRWKLSSRPAGSLASISDPSAASPSFGADVRGTYLVELVVNDGQVDSLPDTLVVRTANSAPSLAAIGDRAVALGRNLVLELAATDIDGDLFQYSALPLPLPAGASLDEVTGLFKFRPGPEHAGTLEISFAVSDGSLTAAETVVITVVGPEPGGETALAGRLLDTNDFVAGTETPISGATVSLLGTGILTTTNSSGEFLLLQIPAGDQVLDIDSSPALPAPDGSPYAGFREKIHLIEGVTNVVDRPFFLPRIDRASLTVVNPNATTVVTNPNLEITIVVPPHAARNPGGGDFDGALSISIVPESLAPAALPEELGFGEAITIQPVGVVFDPPVPISFSNLDGLSPGSEVDIWSLDPESGTFVIVGTGRVTLDGARVDTVAGGIRAADWHGILPPGGGLGDSQNNNDNRNRRKRCHTKAGSAVALATGNVTVDHDVASYRSQNASRSLRLVYNTETAAPRPVVSTETTVPVRAAVPPKISLGITVGGVGGGGEVFTDTSDLDENMDESIRQVIQYDASHVPTGLYPYRLEVTSHYPFSRIGSFLRGELLVHNERASPFGAGWSISGLQRAHVSSTGSVVLTDGDGSAQVFAASIEEILIFSDDFDSENGGSGRVNVPALGNWDITDGSVDLLGNGFVDFFPGNGLYLDLDGSTGNAGRIETKAAFSLDPGEYELRFDLAGSQRGGSDTVTVSMGGVFQEEITLEGSRPLETFIRRVTIEDAASVKIVLDHAGGDNIGILLFNVKVVRLGDILALRSPPGDSSALNRNDDGTLTREFADGTEVHFNAAGLQVAVVDRNGSSTSYDYDEKDRLVTVTDPVGQATTLIHDGERVARITDPAGRTTSLEHDADGHLVSITDPDGATTRFDYDDAHRLVAQTSRRGFVTAREYDAARAGILTRLPDGTERRVRPADTFGLPDLERGLGTFASPAPVVRPGDAAATLTDGRGNLTRYRTDRFGGAAESTDPLGGTTLSPRDGAGDATRIVSPGGNVSLLTHDPMSNLLSLREAAGTVIEREWSAEYEPDSNRRTLLRDPEGNETRFAYDSQGNVVASTDALGGIRRMAYDGSGLPVLFTDENGKTTAFTHDGAGNLETITDPLGGITRMRRDAAGNIVAVTEGLGTPEERTSTFTYDAMNRRLTEANGAGETTRFVYDPAGNLVERTNPDGERTGFVYDGLNRLVAIDDPLRGRSELVHDENGNLAASIDGAGQVTTFEYDELNRLVKTIDALGGEQEVTYDAGGNVQTLTDAGGQTTTFGYDALDRVVEVKNPLGATTTFAYDSRDNLVATRDAKGQVIAREYDSLSRPTGVTTPDNTIRFTLDAAGNALAVEDNDSKVLLAYDGLNRVVEAKTVAIAGQPEVAITITYDPVGNRRQLLDSEGGVTGFLHDAAGRLTGITAGAAGSITIEYGPAGRFRRIAYPNGVESQFSYDGRGQLQSLLHAVPGGAVHASFTFDQDSRGNVRTLTRPEETLQYTYDALERLTAASTAAGAESYEYDSTGNRRTSSQSATHVHDAAHRLLGDVGFTYAYDANGNLATKTARDGSGVTTYGWDAQNQLIRVELPDGTVASYRYDGLGRRIEKNVGGRVTRYVNDGLDIVLELDGSNALVARYRHGERLDQPLSMTRQGETYFFHADHIGSVRILSNGAGAAASRYEYDSHGNLVTAAVGIENPLAYAGRPLDPETGFLYYRARYYDPRTGRFVSPDPIGFRGGDANLYRYVGNNPVNRVDPFGLISIEPLSCLAVLGIGAATAVVVGGVTAYLVKDEKPSAAQVVDNAVSSVVPLRPTDVIECAEILEETAGDIKFKQSILDKQEELGITTSGAPRKPTRPPRGLFEKFQSLFGITFTD